MIKAVVLAFVLMTALRILAQGLRAETHPRKVGSQEWCLQIPEPAKPLPKSVIRAVMNTKEAAYARKFLREEGKDPYRSAPLEGIRVKLTSSGGPVYLVGGGGQMTGADNRWFWLVQQSGTSARILLHVGTGCVHIDRKSTHSYRDIQTEWQAAGYRIVTEYRWNGRTYKLHRQYQDEVR